MKHRTSDNRRFCQSHSDLRSASGAAAPVEFLEKLAMLIPKPRINRVVYHGVLAPGAGGRAAVPTRDARVATLSDDADTARRDLYGCLGSSASIRIDDGVREPRR